MTAREFFDKVAEMRKCQKEFNRYKNEDTMLDMLELEEEIDKEIERVQDIIRQKRI